MNIPAEIWEKGCTLDEEALSEFGDEALHREIDEFWNSSSWQGLMGNPETDAHRDAKARIDSLWRQLTFDVGQKLRRGELIAGGYPAPRKPDDLPRTIDRETVAGKILWGNRTISHDGLEYVGVRVFLPEWLERQHSESPRKSLPRRRREAIAAVTLALITEGKLDPAAQQSKVNIEIVRERVLAEQSDLFRGKLPSDSTIRRYMLPALSPVKGPSTR